MAVRKRTWTTAKGEEQEAWIADYRDRDGSRCIKTFNTERSARTTRRKFGLISRRVFISTPVRAGDGSGGGKRLAQLYTGLERSTLDQYRQHVNFHIVPFIGELKLSDVNAQAVRRFEDALRKHGRSSAMVLKIIKDLGSILADAQEHGTVARNAVRELKAKSSQG